MSRKKIVFLSHSSRLNGAERCLLTLASKIDPEKYDSLVICPAQGPLVDKLEQRGVRHLVMPMFKWVFRSVHDNKTFFMDAFHVSDVLTGLQLDRIGQAVKDFGCDVLVTNTLTIKHGAVLSHRLNIPHMWMVQESLSTDSQWKQTERRAEKITEFIVRNSDSLIFCSNATKKDFAACIRDPGMLSDMEKKSDILYLGVDESADNMPLKDDSEKDVKKIALVGAIMPSKGQMETLKAFESVSKGAPGCELEFAGHIFRKDYLRDMREYMKENGMSNVRYIGIVHDIFEYLSDVDILIAPSKSEPFSRVILEGMMAGIPVIASKKAGITELLDDKENIVLVDPHSPEEIASAMKALISDKELYRRISRNGLKRSMEINNVDRYLKNFEEMIEKTCEKS